MKCVNFFKKVGICWRELLKEAEVTVCWSSNEAGRLDVGFMMSRKTVAGRGQHLPWTIDPCGSWEALRIYCVLIGPHSYKLVSSLWWCCVAYLYRDGFCPPRWQGYILGVDGDILGGDRDILWGNGDIFQGMGIYSKGWGYILRGWGNGDIFWGVEGILLGDGGIFWGDVDVFWLMYIKRSDIYVVCNNNIVV